MRCGALAGEEPPALYLNALLCGDDSNCGPQETQGRKVSGPGNGKGFRRLAFVFVVVIKWPWSMSQHRECAAGPGSSLRAWYPELDSQLHELLNSLQGVPLMLTVCSRMHFRF